MINDAASKVRKQYDDILQALLIEGHDESEAKEEAFEKILPYLYSKKELGDVYKENDLHLAFFVIPAFLPTQLIIIKKLF